MKTAPVYLTMAVSAAACSHPATTYAAEYIVKQRRIARLQAIETTTTIDPQKASDVSAKDSFTPNLDGKLVRTSRLAVIRNSPFSGISKSDNATAINTPITGINAKSEAHAASAQDAAIPKCGPSPFNPAQIKALVRAAARREGIDELFALAIVEAESHNDVSRNSPKGARGPMQLIPDTAARYGVKDICDPAENIAGGMAYLKDLTKAFHNPLLVAAAYNAGEQSVYKYGGIPPYGETVAYVAKVMNLAMGLPMPSQKVEQSAPSPANNDPATGVIQTATRGAFVAGVMQF